MSWQGFWRWVDDDFNRIKPFSFVLFLVVAGLPLFFVFLFEASNEVVEVARAVSLIGVMVVMAYYVYRASKNIARSFKTTFGSSNSREDGGSNNA